MQIKAGRNDDAQIINAPVAVLRLYSAMINDMADDGVLPAGCFSDHGSQENQQHRANAAAFTANTMHSAAAVSAALRWAMGLQTMLPLGVHLCAQVLWCAPQFRSCCSLQAGWCTAAVGSMGHYMGTDHMWLTRCVRTVLASLPSTQETGF